MMEDYVDRACFSMDYAETWHITEEDADRVLWQHSHKDLPCRTNEKEIFAEWERLKRKEIDLDLHGVFLSDYYRAKRIPRGFRIHNVPTIGRSNPDFCKKWIGVLNRCSFDLMILVLEEVSGDLTKVRKACTALEVEHARLLKGESTTEMLGRIAAQVESYKQDLLSFKREKLRRVNEDYTNFRVYRWLTGERQYGHQSNRYRRAPRRKLFKPLNTVDTSSGDSEGDDNPPGATPLTVTDGSGDLDASAPHFLDDLPPVTDRPPSGRGKRKSTPRGGGRRGRGRRI